MRAELGKGEVELSVLEQWVLRRSDADVTAFRTWFNDMYRRDPEVGMKMLDWNMPSIWDLPDSADPPPPVPTEWTRLKKVEKSGEMTGDASSGQGGLLDAESLLRRLLQKRTGVDSELIKMAEFCLTMGLLSVLLIFAPPFAREWVQRGPERDPQAAQTRTGNLPPGVGGVDAYLLQPDFGKLDSPLGLSECNVASTPSSSDRSSQRSSCSDDAVKTLTTEMRSQVKKLIKQGISDQELLLTPLSSTSTLSSSAPLRPSAADIAKLRIEVAKETAAKASQTSFWRQLLHAPRYDPDAGS